MIFALASNHPGTVILRDGSLQVLSEADRWAAGVYRGPADGLRGGQQPLQGRHDRPAGLGRLQVLLGRGRHAQVSGVTRHVMLCHACHAARAIRGTDESVFAEGAGVGGRNRVGYWGDNNWEDNTGNTNQKVGGAGGGSWS